MHFKDICPPSSRAEHDRVGLLENRLATSVTSAAVASGDSDHAFEHVGGQITGRPPAGTFSRYGAE